MRPFLLIAALPLAACSSHSDGTDSKPGTAAIGTGATRTFAISDFSGVDLRGSDDVDVRVGTGFSVRAEGPSKDLDRLKIVKTGDVLEISRIDDNGFGWGGGDHRGVKVFVTMPRIAGAGVEGSGNMTIDRVDGERFAGNITGSGNLDVAALNVQAGDFAVAGSGNIDLKGTARHLKMDVTGSGEIDAGGLKAESADVTAGGSGDIRAVVAGQARVSLTGSGDVDLSASAHCTTTKTGSGDVHCGS